MRELEHTLVTLGVSRGFVAGLEPVQLPLERAEQQAEEGLRGCASQANAGRSVTDAGVCGLAGARLSCVCRRAALRGMHVGACAVVVATCGARPPYLTRDACIFWER